MQRARETPIHIVPGSSGTSQDYGAVLRDLADDPDASQCVVELEVGRYDKDVQKVQLPLSFYLDWLVRGDESGQMNGKQVYLAQWRGLQDIPALRQSLGPPSFLQTLFDGGTADLYQASCFVGPSGAMTPLHYDPYVNLFRLADCSDATAGKHFTILPPSPSVSAILSRGGSGHLQNTSPVELELCGRLQEGHVDDVIMSPDSPSRSHFDTIAGEAFGVTLRKGEMLLLPHRWWHRVQNLGSKQSWTAGVGYWFRFRENTSAAVLHTPHTTSIKEPRVRQIS